MSTYPTADGLYPPSLMALLAHPNTGNGVVDLSAYDTTLTVNTKLSLKADASLVGTLTNNLSTLATTVGNMSVGTGIVYVEGNGPFTIVNAVNDLDKVYIVRSLATGTTPVQVNIGMAFDDYGDGYILIYNASNTTPLHLWATDCVFLHGTAPVQYNNGQVDIAVGAWMFLKRTDQISSGYTVSGGMNPSSSFRIVP
jgi:hypothetical protein